MNEENKVVEMDVTDYTDPQCPFCVDAYKSDAVKPVDIGRIITKLDEHLARNDYAAAERHLLYWLEEAKQGNDLRGQFSLHEECMGLFRKLGKQAEAEANAAAALRLIDKLELGGTVSAATSMLNAATVYKAFGKADKGEPLFREARPIYERLLSPTDERLAGLYNNYALALVDLKKFEEARALYERALEVINATPGREPEAAITELNLASLAEAELGLEGGEKEIERRLERAEALLKKEGLAQDGNYAFVAEKCASVFGYYGWFGTEAELKAAAEKIYGGNR